MTLCCYTDILLHRLSTGITNIMSASCHRTGCFLICYQTFCLMITDKLRQLSYLNRSTYRTGSCFFSCRIIGSRCNNLPFSTGMLIRKFNHDLLWFCHIFDRILSICKFYPCAICRYKNTSTGCSLNCKGIILAITDRFSLFLRKDRIIIPTGWDRNLIPVRDHIFCFHIYDVVFSNVLNGIASAICLKCLCHFIRQFIIVAIKSPHRFVHIDNRMGIAISISCR